MAQIVHVVAHIVQICGGLQQPPECWREPMECLERIKQTAGQCGHFAGMLQRNGKASAHSLDFLALIPAE